ncbi:uncharacterized protein LOC119616103 [Lucilia sericata]|uniref:uncharacterized protein LOC119616103 n=1 Tax=Lucilia sericata TaxID=13632 RepID=UPI0018A82E70|nr:uncharacterized protein LOC119616103 [Lucilia sericata]XP_037828220.1 uncharacterized protein LOC119616103 [Lucilia sericata]
MENNQQFWMEEEDENSVLSSSKDDNNFTFLKDLKNKDNCESELLNVAKQLLEKELNSPENEDVFKWWYAKFEKLHGKQKELAQRICIDAVFAAAKGSLNYDVMKQFRESLSRSHSTTSDIM